MLPGVGPRRQQQLGELGISSIRDLLFVLPVGYEDRRVELAVSALPRDAEGTVVTLGGRLEQIRTVPTRRRSLRLTRASFSSPSGPFRAIWFNRPYLAGSLINGKHYRLTGKLKLNSTQGPELANASVEEGDVEGRLTPIYPRLGELGPAAVSRIIAAACDRIDWSTMTDDLPVEVLQKRRLPTLGSALSALHEPQEDASTSDLERQSSPGHRRLIYGDLLELQFSLAAARKAVRSRRKPHRYRFDEASREALKRLLPFRLTEAQRKVFREIVTDMRSTRPMLRLLQGDVGSGKTIVALMAAVVACESEIQCAVMAPTELLAEQHFETLSERIGGRYRAELLTSSVDTTAVAERLSSGETQLVIGTHALIQDAVAFERLGLVIVDEQHRFGLDQRRRLLEKGAGADLLVMTATPIPRTMALLLYGDLDLSVIDELPPGRRARRTEWIPASRRSEVLDWLRRELEGGGQAYVVFPVIERSESLGLVSLEMLGEVYRKELSDHRVGVVTGRMSPQERIEQLNGFRRGEIRCLLATTVIEVGVDVPTASAMIVEGAERFGLAQLHQLRGRIGRGSRQSRCYAIATSATEDAVARLDAFQQTEDGFAIAEADLALRGAGDLFGGTRQAGRSAGLGWAALGRHPELLEWTREDARTLLARQDAGVLAKVSRRRAEEILDGG